jgi:ABC-type uncharacterized transport system auxiliary subunit
VRAAALLALLALGACGGRQTLHPAAGRSLPPKPATSPTQPTADMLMTPPSNVRPLRSDELLTRSQPREQDPFNLPPES